MDDGSTDGSTSLLDAYYSEKGMPQNFKIIHQSNRGVSAARNVALDVAKGDWIQFLDSDDSLELDFFECAKREIDRNEGVDAVEHSAIYVADDGVCVLPSPHRRRHASVLTGDEILADAWGRKFTYLAGGSCYKLFRREIIERNHLRFLEGVPISEDELFARLFYACANRIAIVPSLSGYRRIRRQGSALMSITAEKLFPQVRATRYLYEFWKERGGRGLGIAVGAAIVMLSSLGARFGREIRNDCIEFLLRDRCYSKELIPALMRTGTLKAQCFAVAYFLSPQFLRRKLLWKIAKVRSGEVWLG